MKKRIIATGSIAVALFLGSYAVSAGDFREELGVDPVLTRSLVQQGFNPSQIQKIFTGAPLKKNYNKPPLDEE